MHIDVETSKQRIPWLMAGGRALLGPVMVIGERAGWNGLTLAALVISALLSDIFDGVLARRWKCDTPGVRLFDSMVDIVFYLGCAAALWMRHPQMVKNVAIPLLAVIGMEALRLAFDLIKFGKPASYHSYLAKTWGLVLATALVAAFATEHATAWIVTALALGILCNVEGLAMSIMMPVWRQDVKTLAVAWRLRGISQRRGTRLIAKTALAAVLLSAACTLSAHAQQHGEAIYESGTSSVAANTTAPMIAAAENLRFEAPAPLAIPYDRIDDTSWRKDVREHMGFFPAMFVGMFAAREHIYRLTLSYHNDAGVHQAAVFQLNRDDAIALSELLRARVPQCSEKGHCVPLYDE